MLRIVFCLIIFSSIAASAQIGHKNHGGSITGTWIAQDTANKTMLVLGSHGTGQMNGQHVKYSTHHRDKLHITASHVTTIYTYELDGDHLTLTGGDFENPIVFDRGSAAIQTTAANSHDNSEHKIPKQLLGLWKGYNETIQFKPDAQCLYRGQIWPYVVNGNVITMQTPQGNFIMNYVIHGRDLRLSFGGTEHVYTKEISVELVQTREGKTLDLSIAGKWCYHLTTPTAGKATECLILSENGAYEYTTETSQGNAATYSDTGTWWLDGNKLFFMTKKQGEGYYTFEKLNDTSTGEAMISIDGKPFVSASNHAPW